MAEVNVAHFEAGTLAAEAARAERREATTVGQARQRVDLVHELAELAGAEEFLDRSDDRANVHQRGRRDRLYVLGGHALAHHALHTAEADAHLVLDQLADAADATVGEVVLVVEAVARLLLNEVQHVADRGEHLVRTKHARIFGIAEDRLAVRVVLIGLEERTECDRSLAEQLVELRNFAAELAIELVATDARQVVATVLEERVTEVRLRRFDRRRLAWAGTLVDLDQRFALRGGDVTLFFPLAFEEAELRNEALEEPRSMLFVVAERAQQGEHTHATLARNARASGDVFAWLLLDVEFQPLATVRVNSALDELMLAEVTKTETLARLEDDAGATHELRHDDALGAVDDERALLGHHREVAHEDGLLFDLARVAVHEASAHEDRCAVRHVLFLALIDSELRRWAQVFVVGVELKLELQCLAEVLDRRNVAEGLGQAVLQEPFEADPLNSDEVWKLKRLRQVGEGIALAGNGTGGHVLLLNLGRHGGAKSHRYKGVAENKTHGNVGCYPRCMG